MKPVSSLILCLILVASGTLALAGGAVQPAYQPAPYPGKAYGAAGNPCAYWGDAPFPGMCGGVVALPFLVVGSLLGGNTMGPCAPAAPPIYGAPAVRAPQPYAAPVAPVYGAMGGGMLSGLPCLDICAGLFGSVTGGFGLGL